MRDRNREDDLYIYVPSIRRVRRAPPIQRCGTLAPSEFNFDDIKSFNGKMTDFSYQIPRRKKNACKLFPSTIAVHIGRGGTYLPLEEEWEIQQTYMLEITPKDPNYCYPKKVLYIDKNYFDTVWTIVWDTRGNYWKEQFAFRTQVKLSDGQPILSIGTVVMTNVQNGRINPRDIYEEHTTKAINQASLPLRRFRQ